MYRNLLPEYRLYLKRSELTDAATLLRSVRELETLLREQTRPTGRADKQAAPAELPTSWPTPRPPQRTPPLHRPDSSPPPPCAGGVDRRDTFATSAPDP
jgi:hypothetical protein